MADVSDPAIADNVLDVRNDNTETNWATFTYKDKAVLVFEASGSGGHAELMQHLPNDKVKFALLRLADGDRESRRVKFVFLMFTGDQASAMARARAGTHVGSIKPLMGLCHIDMQADTHRECTEELMRRKLKAAAGADYDTGSNSTGYQSSGNLKERALAAYKEKEKEGNVAGVVYFKSALPSSTPVDLSNRPMVAAASEVRRNTVLDMKKPDTSKPRPVATNKPLAGGASLSAASSSDAGRRSASPAAQSPGLRTQSPAVQQQEEPSRFEGEESQQEAENDSAAQHEAELDSALTKTEEEQPAEEEAQQEKETQPEPQEEEPQREQEQGQEQEQEQPAAAAEAEADTRVFTAPFADVKAFLVKNGLLDANFDGSPEDLASFMRQ